MARGRRSCTARRPSSWSGWAWPRWRTFPPSPPCSRRTATGSSSTRRTDQGSIRREADGPERLQKALARAGYGSRRSAEELIRAGRVRIGKRVAVLGDRVDPRKDQVFVDEAPVGAHPDLRHFALNKPAGVTTTPRAVRASVRESARDRTALSVVMAEGRKREVRRMLAAVGCPVRRLVRVRVGPVKLGALRPGALRPLTAEELAELYRSTGLRRAAP